MGGIEEDTPPHSINSDDIRGSDEEMLYLGDLDDDLFIEGEEFEPYDDPIVDNASLTFEKHTGSVFCCDLHPSFNLAVTGGEDDKAYVWNVETGEVTLTCDEFKDSVIFAEFSSDGAYLAAADMMGVIKVWECKENEPWPVVFDYETGDVTFGLWHFGARVLIFGTESGQIYIFKIPSGKTKVLQGNNVKVEYGKLFPDGTRLAVGYNDGTLKVWDIKSEKAILNTKINDEGNGVTDIAIHHDNNLMAAVGENGEIALVLSNGKSAGVLRTNDNIECLTFSQDADLGYLASGTLAGSLIIWETSHQLPRNICTVPANGPGVIKFTWIKNRLLTVCIDGSVRIYDGRSGDSECVLTGHSAEVLDFAHSVQRNIILTASDDGTARIFKFDFNKELL